MLRFNLLLMLTLNILCTSAFCANDFLDKNKYESLTNFKGSYNEEQKVFKVSFPRDDIKIVVDNLQMDPFMGVTSWASFKLINKNKFMIMGDLVLFEDEVNPVMSILLDNQIEVTALHNHFFYDKPRVYFMHIGSKGNITNLSSGLKIALDTIKDIRIKKDIPDKSFGGLSIANKNSIESQPLETIFETKGQSKSGMVKFIFGRSIKIDHITINSEMGVNTWASFAGTPENAIVDGDFVVFVDELQGVLKILRNENINIVAIHNHMINESPRVIFIHYWGKGNVENLAKTIKKALNFIKK